MDTDSVPSALVFAASLLLFSYLSLGQRSALTPGNFSKTGVSLQKAAPLLRPFKQACVIAAALSGLALAHSVGASEWWFVSLLALCVLGGLIIVDRAAAIAASRSPGKVDRICIPLSRLLNWNGHRDAAGANGNAAGSESNGNAFPDDSLTRDYPVITEAELGSLDYRDREMLRSILSLDVTTAREIMVPRLDMVAVDDKSTLTQVADQMVQSGHSRIPVYEDTIDHVLGVVHSRDVLAALARPDSKQTLRHLINPAFFIPETKRLDDLLEELQDKGIQMAIVVDEYGGTEGLVTIEDLLEEIVGEIEDEFSRTREAELVRLPDGGALVDASVSTEDIEELFATTINSTDVDTVGGFVYQTLGKIPSPGDVVSTDHLRIEVVSILGRRLRKLHIQRRDSNASTPNV